MRRTPKNVIQSAAVICFFVYSEVVPPAVCFALGPRLYKQRYNAAVSDPAGGDGPCGGRKLGMRLRLLNKLSERPSRKLRSTGIQVPPCLMRQLRWNTTQFSHKTNTRPAARARRHRNFSSASNAAGAAPRSRNKRRTRGLQVRRLPEHATTLHDAPASALK